MRKMMNRLNKREGFTLAELLIVVAIIAVLVAIAIPVFSGQLEKSRESTDAANIRAAYAEVVAKGLTDSENDATLTVNLVQQQDGWQNTSIGNIAGVSTSNIPAAKSGTVEVKYTGSTGKVTIAGKETTNAFSTP